MPNSPQIGFLYDAAVLEHRPPTGHPERPERVSAIGSHLQQTGLWQRLRHLPVRAATRAEMERVHSADYLDMVETIVRQGGGLLDAGDTVASAGTWRAVTMASGAAVGAVEAVMEENKYAGAFALVRPPGHHARPNQAMGFCIVNHAAVAAAHAIAAYGLSRVLLVDFDVHHGNGTQEAFYDDPRVLYVSTHQSPAYPFTGMIDETGVGKGAGFTVNVPLPPQVDDVSVLRAFDEILVPVAVRYQPQLIILSAGYDAHWRSRAYVQGIRTNMTVVGLAALSARVQAIAEVFCPGRLVGILEGGYDLESLAWGVSGTLRRWMGDMEVDDPIGSYPDAPGPPDISNLLAAVRRTHVLPPSA